MNSIMGLEKSSHRWEKVDSDYGHINGSPNIPMTMFRQRFQGLRKDQPVYLCDANGLLAIEPLVFLKRMDIQISVC